jgi:O-antigen/teichoic acid export membrane protein
VTQLRALLGTAATAGDRRPVSLSLGTSVAAQVLNMVTGLLLARALGPAGRGELAAAMLWPGLLAVVGSLGVVDAITYFTARRNASRDRLVASSLVLGTAQSAVLVLVGLAVVPRALSHHGDAVVRAGLVFLAYLPLYLLGMYLISVLNGLGRHAWFQALRLLLLGVSAGGLVALALTGRLTVLGAVGVYLVAHLVVLLVALFPLRAALHRSSPDPWLVGRLLRYGAASHVGSVTATLNERLDQLIISVLLPSASLGLYAVAVTLTSAVTLVGSSIALVALPALARIDDRPARVAAGRHFVLLALAGSAPVALALTVTAPWLLRVFFGAGFVAATGPARLLLAGAVALSVGRVLAAILRAAGRPLDAGTAELAAIVVTGAGLALLLPRLGLLGAALTSLAAYLVSTGWMLRKLRSGAGLSPADLFGLGPRRAASRHTADPSAGGAG